MIVLDAHCDAPSQMYRLRDYSLDNPNAQVDFPKLRRGGVDCSFFAAYVPARLEGEEATVYARKLLDEAHRQVEANSDKVAIARCSSGIRRNRRSGLTSVVLAIENASAVQESFELLAEFKKRGVRYITLSHSADNQVGDSCTGYGRWGGLSPFGRELVREMNRIGMMVDVAHASNKTIEDVLEVSRKPIAYTHGCCSALSGSKRNLPDTLIKGIAQGGGVVCMSIYPPFLSDDFRRSFSEPQISEMLSVEDSFIANPSDDKARRAWEQVLLDLRKLPRPGVGAVADHIEHAVSVAGVEHVGIGTDYDGIEVTAQGLESVDLMPRLWDELKSRGFNAKEISMIAGENLLRLMKEVRKK